MTQHSALPRRPARTSQREHDAPSEGEQKAARSVFTRHDVLGVYSTVELTSGAKRTIFRTRDSVHVASERDGEPAGGFRFAAGEDSQILSRAIQVALTTSDPRARNVGKFFLPSGAAVEVGAWRGVVVFRWNLPSGEKRRGTRIREGELEHLRKAVEDLHAASADELNRSHTATYEER